MTGLAPISIAAPFIAIAASALTLATPPERRGLTSAVFLLIYNLVGFGLGPTVVAWLSERPGADHGNLGVALGTVFIVVAPLAAAAFFMAQKPMRRAVDEVQGAAEGTDPAAA